MLTEADEELFEDNPEEYMRRDIEGSGKMIVALSFSNFMQNDVFLISLLFIVILIHMITH